MNFLKYFVLVWAILLSCLFSALSFADNQSSLLPQELIVRAQSGDVEAQFKLALMFDIGVEVKQDKKEAVKWYWKAAEQGHAITQNILGSMYYDGEGVKQDKKEAMKWYKKAAEQGYADAQYNLAVMYYKGEGVNQDKKEAVKWVRRAAEQGNASAQLYLGTMYYYGKGVKQDKKEAAKWGRRAAEQGNASAQLYLGSMYYDGEGVKQDKKEAAKWYRKATEQGHAFAQYNLGWMYYDGKGVMQNETMAYALWSLAGVNGNEDAIKTRDIVAKKLSRQEIKEGRKIASNLQKKIDGKKSSKANVSQQEIVTATDEPKISGSGSGFIITNNGYIITCYHVIKGASKIKILTNNREYPAKLIRADKHNDVALLKIDGTFPALAFAPRNSVKMGSEVFTIGYPNPILQGVNKKYTEGNINALTGYQDDIRLYQISTPIQPGNSGGPLLNENGDVIGIIVALLKAETAFAVTGSLPQNVNYALKTLYVQALLDTVPEAVNGLQKPHEMKSGVVERIQKSVVMVLAYE